MKKLSIKLRVTLWYTIAMILISLIAITATSSVTKDMINTEMHGRVRNAVNGINMRAVDRTEKLRHIPDHFFFERGVQMAIYDKDFKLIKGNPPFGIDFEQNFVHDSIRKISHNGNSFYVYDRKTGFPTSQNYVWIKGVISIDESSYALNSTLKNNLLLTVILIISASIGGYFIISRAFVPVNKIRKTAVEIYESNDLSRRINIEAGNDEIHSLADTFDKMLNKIEKTFEMEKQFTSDASHELRTPVSVILSECDYALNCANTIDEYKESVDSIKRQSEKMSKLISELLTISRMDKNTIQTNFEEINISELLSFVCDEQEEIRADKITLIRNISDNICAIADRFLIARMFINIISNAYQYNSENGSIWVSLENDEKNVFFTVRDNGIGISTEHIDKIWERFYQADPARSSNETGNMGLGLSMVKWIVSAHNGNISVTSQPGCGSEFKVIFPHNITSGCSKMHRPQKGENIININIQKH